MDKRLKSMLCLLIASLMAVMVTSSCSYHSECETIDFGPPEVILNCLVDYVKLNKVVEVLWKPTLKNGSRTPHSSIDCCIDNCEANINCGHGYRNWHPCPHESEENGITIESYVKWKFPSVGFIETLCTVKVVYTNGITHTNSKLCSYSAPSLAISKQNSLVNATVGKPYWIQCSVSTIEEINSSIVKIDWSGPDGPITNDNRITVHPTVSDDGIIHNSTLQFLYLSQNDAGAFTCNVTILDTNISETFLLDNITTLGPPSVNLKCLADYVKLNKTVEVSWKPSLLSSATHLSTENINERAQVYVQCKGGYNHTHEFAAYNETADLYVRWNFSIPIHEKFCSVQVGYLDFVDQYQAAYKTSKNCSFSDIDSTPSLTTTTSASPTASTISGSSIPTNFPSASSIRNDTFSGGVKVSFILFFVISFLFISVLIGVSVYKFTRKLKSCYFSKSNVHFKVPSISDIAYSVTNKDDESTCENLDETDKITP